MASEISQSFARAFQEAGNISPHQYSDLIRFIAILLLILSLMWTMHHFLSMEAKESDSFMVRLGSRLVRISLALTLFIFLLTT